MWVLKIGGKEGQGKQSDTKKDSRSGRGTFLEGKQTIEPAPGNSSVSRAAHPIVFADSKRKAVAKDEERRRDDHKVMRKVLVLDARDLLGRIGAPRILIKA
ncbi:hypothetical protein APHAL10511_003263 [Amanita phalloides]|nr:hypothetical protein APHAL10511_003263 [Amanita phalloides]